MNLLYAALAHERYSSGNACSSSAFLARLDSGIREVVIDTSVQAVEDTTLAVLREIGIKA
jgi:hypothetical protein